MTEYGDVFAAAGRRYRIIRMNPRKTFSGSVVLRAMALIVPCLLLVKAATAQRAFELFMGSAGHKANILNSLHDAIGIGIVSNPSGVVVTQLFIGD